MDLTERVLEGELMDAPGLEAAPHKVALQALERVNWLSGTATVVSRAIIQHCGQQYEHEHSGEPLRILDLACGGGDVTLAVQRKLAAAGLNSTIEAWDRSHTAIEFAKQRTAKTLTDRGSATGSAIQFLQRDVMELEGERCYDAVICTLFLHHLDRDAAIQLLSKMYRAASRLVLVDDLRRTWVGYRLAQLGCVFLTRSPIVHVDGPLSVRAAFTEAELLTLCREARLPPPAFLRHWPQRFLLRWDRSL